MVSFFFGRATLSPFLSGYILEDGAFKATHREQKNATLLSHEREPEVSFFLSHISSYSHIFFKNIFLVEMIRLKI